MKKGRHRRFEEARALKRGPDIDIESILDAPPLFGDAANDEEVEDDDYDEYDPDRWSGSATD